MRPRSHSDDRGAPVNARAGVAAGVEGTVGDDVTAVVPAGGVGEAPLVVVNVAVGLVAGPGTAVT